MQPAKQGHHYATPPHPFPLTSAPTPDLALSCSLLLLHSPVVTSVEVAGVLPVHNVGSSPPKGREIDHVLDENGELLGPVQHCPGSTQGQLTLLGQGAPRLGKRREDYIRLD